MALSPESIRLHGRCALVTGAARGIGESIALAFARFGASLAICDREGDALSEVAEAIRGTGVRVESEVFDVRDGDAFERFATRAAGGLGALHVLVNNAGGTFEAPLLELGSRGEAALVAENFTSVTNGVRATVPRMPDAGGSIVNVTSVEAWRAAPGYAVYAAMKAAVENLTRSLALELAERRIRVNCIAPDAIPTPGTGGSAAPTPLPDPGHPDDVAAAALYLASDLSRFVTGTTLHVDGGAHAAGGWRRREGGGFEL